TKPAAEKQADVPADSAEPTKAPSRGRKKAVAEPVVEEAPKVAARPSTSLLFQAPDPPTMVPPRSAHDNESSDDESPTVRRRSRRRSGEENQGDEGTAPNTVVKVRQPRQHPEPSNEPQKVRGSTRLEAKKQRRRDGRDAGRRRP